jgi:hypothetical protein
MIPAIILTGDISTESLRDIAGHGCVLLNKPVRAMDLTRLVEILLPNQRLRRQARSSSCPSAWERERVSRPLFLSLTTTKLSGKR